MVDYEELVFLLVLQFSLIICLVSLRCWVLMVSVVIVPLCGRRESSCITVAVMWSSYMHWLVAKFSSFSFSCSLQLQLMAFLSFGRILAVQHFVVGSVNQ